VWLVYTHKSAAIFMAFLAICSASIFGTSRSAVAAAKIF